MAKPRRTSILRRYATISLVALLCAAGASLFLSYLYNSDDVMQESRKVVEIAAKESEVVMGDVSYQEMCMGSTSEDYEDTRLTLQLICKMLNVCHLYVYEMSDAQTVTKYLLTVSNETSENDAASLTDEATDSLTHGLAQEQHALEGVADPDPVVIGHGDDKDLSWCFPLYLEGRADPLVMRIDVDNNLVTSRIFDNTLAFAVPMIAIELVVVLLGVGMLKRNVSNPLRLLSERMRGFVQDGVKHDEPLELGRTDEIGEICESYNQMTRDIDQYVDQIESMTQDRVAAETELAVAQRIQQGLVPTATELSGTGFEAYASLRMARAVGGDFYDLALLDDGRVMLVLADVSGKGVSAALFMAMSRTLTYDVLSSLCDPAEALNKANDLIASNNPECMFVTLIAGIFDPSTGVLTYANAGHTPPLVVGKGYEAPDPGIALGLFEDAGIVNETIHLGPGEGILLYTDGATEANNANNEFFGEERLERAVENTAHPADTIHAAVEAIDTFVGDHEQFDDLTMLSLFATE